MDFSNGDQITARCELRDGASVIDSEEPRLFDADFADQFEYTLTDAVALPAGGTLSLHCRVAHDHPGHAASGEIMAIQVTSIG